MMPGPGEYKPASSFDHHSNSYTVPKAETRTLVYRPPFPGPGEYSPNLTFAARRPQADIVPRRKQAKGHWWRPTPGADVYGHTMPAHQQKFPIATIGNAKRVTDPEVKTAAPPRVGPGLYEISSGVAEGKQVGLKF